MISPEHETPAVCNNDSKVTGSNRYHDQTRLSEKANIEDDQCHQLAVLAVLPLLTSTEDIICTVKGAYCKSMQHRVADTSQTALSHRLLQDFHQRQTDVQSKISNTVDIFDQGSGCKSNSVSALILSTVWPAFFQ